MKTSPSSLLAASVSAFLVTVPSVHADLAFTAPGMTQAGSVKGTSVDQTVNLGKYWRYEIIGCEWKLTTGRPVDGSIAQDGTLLGEGASTYAGASTLGCAANSNTVLSNAGLATSHLDTVSGDSCLFDAPIIIQNGTVFLNFKQSTNMTNDGGSYCIVRAIALKEPPVPTGELSVSSSLVREGTAPSLNWLISRSGTESPYPPITPGQGPAKDSKNSGPDRTNNGHGNNEDGVDSSNPGKSAQVWNDKFGIIDQSANDADPTNDDDESKGGGAAPSK